MSQPAPPAAPPTAPAAGAKRRFGSTGDMVRSTLAVLAIVLGIVALVPRSDAPVTDPVDVAVTAAQAADVAPYPVLAPEGLGPQWRANRADVRRLPDGSTVWRVGFSTPQDRFVRLVQSDGPAEAFLTEEAGRASAEGSLTIGGEQWEQLLTAEEERRTLWRAGDGSTVVVTGTASYEELAELVEALRAS